MKRRSRGIPTPHQEVVFARTVAAQLASISLDFLEQLEGERLIAPRLMARGEPGYSAEDIRHLARIRRLSEDLGLDLAAVDVVLHLRRQVAGLRQRLDEVELQLRRREQELLEEIQDLRRRLAVTISGR